MQVMVNRANCLVKRTESKLEPLSFPRGERLGDVGVWGRMIYCGERAEAICFLVGLLDLPRRLGVDLIIEVRVVKVKVIGIDSNHRAYMSLDEHRPSGPPSLPPGSANALTVLRVQFPYFERVLTPSNNVIIELIPVRDDGQLGTGEFGQWMEIESVYDEVNDGQNCQHRNTFHDEESLEKHRNNRGTGSKEK